MRARISLALVGALAGLALSIPASAAPAQTSERAWLALGDSYSSGEGIPGTNDVGNAMQYQSKDCNRATGIDTDATAWAVSAHRSVADELGIPDQMFVACTGAVSDDLGSQIGEAQDRKSRDRWDLITFSIGGNDIDFAGVLTACLDLEASWRTVTNIGCDHSETELRGRIDDLRSELETRYDLVASKVNPGGDVVVVGYPQLVEEIARWDGWRRNLLYTCEGIEAFDVGMLRSVTGYLNEQLALAVRDADARWSSRGVRFHFLDISADPYEYSGKPTDRHALCAPVPWLNGRTVGWFSGDAQHERSFHPLQVGHTNTGRVLASYLRDNVRFDDVPPLSEGQLRYAPVPALCDQTAGPLQDGLRTGTGEGGVELNRVAIGDFDGRAGDEAAVTVVCSHGGSPADYAVLVYRPGPVYVGRVPIAGYDQTDGSWWRPGRVTVSGGTLAVDSFDQDDDDPSCCASIVHRTRWRLDGDRIVDVTPGPPERPYTMTPEGIGRWKAGMTRAETSEAFAAPVTGSVIEGDFYSETAECFYFDVVGMGMGGTGSNDRTLSLFIRDDRGIRTRSGLGIGSTLAEVRAAHPEAEDFENIYQEWPDLVLYSEDRSHGIRFISNTSADGPVEIVMVGAMEAVALPEGCL